MAGTSFVIFRELSVRPEDLPSTFRAIRRCSIKVCEISLRQVDLPATSINIPCTWRHFVDFRQLSVWPGDIPSTSVYFPCGQHTFRQLCVREGDLLSTSVSILCGRATFYQLPSTFLVAWRASVPYYSARHHKLPKYSPMHPRVTEKRAVVNCIPYYGKFCVESDSRFRIVVPCTLHKIWQWKQSAMSLANGIAQL